MASPLHPTVHLSRLEHHVPSLRADLPRHLVATLRPAMLEIGYERCDLIAGECLPKCRHGSSAVQNLFAQRVLLLPASNSAEVRSFVTANPANGMALNASLLVEFSCSTISRGFAHAVPWKR